MTTALVPTPVAATTAVATTTATTQRHADRWPTPRRLRALLAMICTGALAMLVLGEGALGRERGAIKTLARDSAPSIIAAQEISAALANLDTNTANYLIGTAQQRERAARDVAARREAVTDRLVAAAQNITYGDAERLPILAMVRGLNVYLKRAAQARMLHDRGDDAGALDAYREATRYMHVEMLPQADALDAANRSHLDAVYAAERAASAGGEGVVIAAGALLVLVLVWTQRFLLRRMRRRVNPALLAATVLVVCYTVYLAATFGAARGDLRVAMQDAFASIHTLYRTRARAFDANGDESRYLFDRPNARAHTERFEANVTALTTQPDLSSADVAALSGGTRPAFGGLFAAELSNITFEGERAAAVAMVEHYAQYYRIDRRIRALEEGGQHATALELCLSYEPGQSNAVYTQFDDALMEVVRINRAVFDRVSAAADARLAWAVVVDPVLAALVVALALAGLRPRLREYAA